MKINICSGYPLDSPKGNSVTAKRLESILCKAGHQAVAMHTDTPPSADAIISLHALKTANATLHFKKHNPRGKILINLTGTDINGGLEEQPELGEKILTLADHLVIIQSAILEDIPPKWHHKTTTIYPSLELPDVSEITPFPGTLFTVVGHLREVKNPHLIVEAIGKTPTTKLTACSIGDSLTAADSEIARHNMSLDSRYHWLKGCSRSEAIAWMKHSTATINTSFSEGGANSIIEAIYLECPVLASSISGNRGLLGDDYLGYFPSNDADALAALLTRCIEEPSFLQTLKSQLSARKPLFSQQSETQGWLKLLELD